MGDGGTSVPIDDFLTGAGRASGGARWEVLGAAVGLSGVVLAVGLVVLLAAVHRGTRAEVRSLHLAATGAGALMLLGGVIELAGAATVLGVGWFDVVTDGSATGGLLRAVGGALVLAGLTDDVMLAEADDGDAGDGDVDRTPAALTGGGLWRWAMRPASVVGIGGVGIGALSFSFDGHTATVGPRVVHALVNVVHVAAGGVWVGGVVGLVVVLARRSGSIGPSLVRFSKVATLALAAVFVAGVAMATMILDRPSELLGTDWGQRLLVKVTAVGLAALLGAYHHWRIVPRLAGGDASIERAARRTLAVEALVLVAAMVMSSLLARASIA